jgi:RNA recognition motif-containing protein
MRDARDISDRLTPSKGDNETKNELYVTNIDFKSYQDDLKKHFEQVGQVIKCKIIH